MSTVRLTKGQTVIFEGQSKEFLRQIKPVETPQKPQRITPPHHTLQKAWEDYVINRTIPLQRTNTVSPKEEIPVRKPKNEKNRRWRQ